ncbi:MAG TPA: NADH-quinone oxidoreductase subunit L [Myxococcota bacterium]|nr:NADH-quinone oxidoreductase subunit L [Myxococcota bacterium]
MSAPVLVILFGPVAVFLLLAVARPLRERGGLAGLLVVAVTASTLWAAGDLLSEVYVSGETQEYTLRWMSVAGLDFAQIGYRVDGVSAGMAVVVSTVALCVQVYSLGYLRGEAPASIGRYFSWQALFVFAMQSLVLAPNLLQLFMGWELVGLCSYLLIGYYWRKKEAGKASLKAFWVNKFGDSFLLLGLVVLVTATGGFGWDLPAGLDPMVATAIGLLIFVGAMAKAAQVPLHVWLPDAMAGPTPVSALLHAATMVAAGVYIVVRGWPLFEASETTLTVMVWVGSITALSAGFFALLQDDVKKLLAFSTCSQLGYMMAALGAGSMSAGYFHLTTHAFFKALLFLAAGALIHAVHSNNMSRMGGLAKSMPVTFVLFTIGALALAGFPGVSGFFSKDMVLEALHNGTHTDPTLWGPLVLLLIGVAVTALYMTRAVLLIFFGEAATKGHRPELSMLLPMLVLAVPSVVIGLWVGDFRSMVGEPGDSAAEMVSHFVGLPAVATAMAFGGFALGIIEHRRGSLPAPAGLADWLRGRPLDSFYEWVWNKAVLVGARGVAWLDRYVIDATMNLVGWSALQSGDRARRVHTGGAADYIWAIGMGVLVLAAFAVLGVG